MSGARRALQYLSFPIGRSSSLWHSLLPVARVPPSSPQGQAQGMHSMENPRPLGHLCKAICSQCCRELKPLIGNALPCYQTHSTRSLCLSALVAPIQSFLQPEHRSYAESQGGDESGLAGDRPFRFRSPDKLTWGGQPVRHVCRSDPRRPQESATAPDQRLKPPRSGHCSAPLPQDHQADIVIYGGCATSSPEQQ